MTGDEINKVVDNLAEKLGVAADKLQPLAEETVRQVQVRGLMNALIAVAVAAMIVAAGWRVRVQAAKRLDASDAVQVEMASWFITVLAVTIALIPFCNNLSQYIAPLPYLLGK